MTLTFCTRVLTVWVTAQSLAFISASTLNGKPLRVCWPRLPSSRKTEVQIAQLSAVAVSQGLVCLRLFAGSSKMSSMPKRIIAGEHLRQDWYRPLNLTCEKHPPRACKVILQVVAEAIATGQAASPQVVRNSRRMIDNDHERNVAFTPLLRIKDVEYALRFAKKLEIGSPFGVLAANQLRHLCDLGHARANETKIIDVSRLQTP